MSPIHPSIAEITEQDLVSYLLAVPHQREWILTIHGIPDDVVPFEQVPLTGVPGGANGDIDILLWSPSQVNNSVAIQAKRVKVGTTAIRRGRPNRLSEYAKGVKQANLLARLGFAQVYLFVFVLVDSREQNAGARTYDGLTAELRSEIDSAITTRDLDGRVGLMKWDFTQPMDYAPFTVGSSGGHLIRSAQVHEQSLELTSWIREIVKQARPV